MAWAFCMACSYACTRCPTLAFSVFGGLSLPLWCKNRNLGELGLRGKVPIRTVLGTGAVLLGLVVVAFLRNFAGVVLGTGYIF